MQRTTQSTYGVQSIVNRARELNPKIGIYQEHFINDNFRFVVRLSNGRLVMSREIAEDFQVQPDSVTQERLQRVADTYQGF